MWLHFSPSLHVSSLFAGKGRAGGGVSLFGKTAVQKCGAYSSVDSSGFSFWMLYLKNKTNHQKQHPRGLADLASEFCSWFYFCKLKRISFLMITFVLALSFTTLMPSLFAASSVHPRPVKHGREQALPTSAPELSEKL